MRSRKRVETLKKILRSKKVDAFLVNKKENVSYLCGCEIEDSELLITSKDRDFVITDARFKERAEEELSDFDLSLVDSSSYANISNIVKKGGIRSLGFESDWLAHSTYSGLRKYLKKTDLIPARGLVESQRILKDHDEITLIKKSVDITKKAFIYAKKIISPKLSGEKLASLIDNFMRGLGASRSSFQTIAAQNPYSSHPHGPSTIKPFGRNCAVLIDFGAVFKRYNSDLTRVVFLGRITTKFKHIYSILKKAQGLALKKVRPGVKISEIDRAARQYIASKGLKKYFLHSLGHGIGLETHESPRISVKNKGVLKTGMVFTIEPGIYIEGWGGLRIEDMALVTKNGCEVLTDDIPK